MSQRMMESREAMKLYKSRLRDCPISFLFALLRAYQHGVVFGYCVVLV